MNANVGSFEQVIRPIVAIAIITAVLMLAQVPPWLALVATYPFFTALLRWDPVYAVFQAIRHKQDRLVLPDAPHGVSV